MRSDATFVLMLVETVPELAPLYIEHLADNGELLSHLLMADFSRYALDLHKQAEAQPKGDAAGRLQRLLSLLDEGMRHGDDPVLNLISTSFLENIAEEVRTWPPLRARMGVALSSELEVILAAWAYGGTTGSSHP